MCPLITIYWVGWMRLTSYECFTLSLILSIPGSKQESAVTTDDGMLGMEDELGEEEEAIKEDPQTHSEDMWLDFEEFCKCFK